MFFYLYKYIIYFFKINNNYFFNIIINISNNITYLMMLSLLFFFKNSHPFFPFFYFIEAGGFYYIYFADNTGIIGIFSRKKRLSIYYCNKQSASYIAVANNDNARVSEFVIQNKKMELQLTRSDFGQVGTISSRDVLRVLPFGRHKRQKIVVGDDDGVITCFAMKRGQASVVYKYVDEEACGKRVGALCLGSGPKGGDKVFAAIGQGIRGINRKGKAFFAFETNLSESISRMVVQGTNIWTGGEFVHNLFDNGIEKAHIMFEDRIGAMSVGQLDGTGAYSCLVGCADRHIRLVAQEAEIADVTVAGKVSALTRYSSSEDDEDYVTFVYGTESGLLGEIIVERGAKPSMRRGWAVHGESAINCMCVHDITKDGVPDLIVGRENGMLDVYSFDMGTAEPTLQFSESVDSSIRCLSIGTLTTPGYEEIVLCTYSGSIISFTTESLEEKDEEDERGRTKAQVTKDAQVTQMRRELEDLESKVEESRKRVQEQCSPQANGQVIVSTSFTVNSRFELNAQLAAYTIMCEIPLPIDVIALQSSFPVSLLDNEDSAMIVSTTSPPEGSDNKLLAVLRSTEPSKRAEIRLRTVEGEQGDIRMIVLPKLTSPGPKGAQQVTFQVKPLSLHQRVHGNPSRGRPMSSLSVNGKFTFSQMHEWLSGCLPGMPARLPEADDDGMATVYFANVYIGCVLVARYGHGSASFFSDSISTAAIIRESLMRESNKRKIRLNIAADINEDTVPHFLSLIDDKVSYQVALASKVRLIDSITEVKAQESNAAEDFLSPEYLDIAANAEAIKKEFERQPEALQTLFGIITDQYVDLYKFKGRDARRKIPELMNLLEEYDLNRVTQFFRNS